MTLSKELEERGFINQFSGESIADILDGAPRTVYHGIDPTADSAHAGNFVNWMLIRHLATAGHKVIFLVGGGTAMIGDPKNDVERPTSDPEQVENNLSKIKAQAEAIFAGLPVEFVNNADWLTKLNLVEFLRDIGKNFTINELIKKEAIAARLAGENGISYTEFAYPLLQAYDYLVLHREYGCDLQVGGSDQWGNILSGVDLIRKKESKTVHAITVPLIVDKTTGKKFGKSEGNAVWLNPEKTSPYEFYQFWLNVADENVIDYLKLFTFLPLEEIESIRLDFELNPGARGAQKMLAHAATTIVHGVDSAKLIEEVSAILFGEGDVLNITDSALEVLLKNAPVERVKVGSLLVDVLVASGLATSKREARTFIESGAINLADQKVESIEAVVSEENFVKGVTILRRGKKQLRVLVLE